MTDNVQPKGATSQVVLGLLLILMGLLFLLDNLDVIEIRRIVSFWPMVFIIAGTVKLCDTQTRGGQLIGTPIMGGFEEKTITPPDGSKRLVVRGYAIMGGVEVRN